MTEIKLDNLGKYRLVEQIGHGRFSNVYRSEHPFLKKTVAVKLMLPALFDNPDSSSRFIQNVRTVAFLKHENIAQILDLAESAGYLYIVMEFMSGGDLLHWRQKQGRINFRQITQILSGIAEALDFAHGQGFVHGDIKPGNILLSEEGSAKLADFGVLHAVKISTTAKADMTRATPQYISPEQADGGQPTPLSDQYALGVVAYELLSGKVPFDGDSPLAIYLKHVREVPIFPSLVNPLVSNQVDAIILKALEKDPEKRFPDCRTFIRALGEIESPNENVQILDLIGRAKFAFEAEDLEGARALIDAALQIAPGHEQGLLLLNNLQLHENTRNNYQDAYDALDNARTNAYVLREELISPSDPDGLLRRLAPIQEPPWKSFLSRWRFSLQLALALGGIGLLLALAGVAFAGISPSNSAPKATMVALVRSATPIPPSVTPTLPFTPTVTLPPTITYTPSPIPTATPVPTIGSGSTLVREKDGMLMVFIPAGSFIMGSDNQPDEKPIHAVDLAEYWFDQTEVTNGMFVRCVQAGVCAPKVRNASFSRSQYYGDPQFAKFPLLHVDWNQARAYCDWAGGRLPTEAEWEKAARGLDGRNYPWGESIDQSMANYNRTVGDTTEVGSYQNGKSPFGAYDLAGNVWEWTSTIYKKYPYNANDGREDLTINLARVLRGGSWSDSDQLLRSSSRYKLMAPNQGDLIGFRCVVGSESGK